MHIYNIYNIFNKCNIYIYIYIYINYSRRYFFKISDISNLTSLLQSVEDSKDSKYHLFKKKYFLE